MWCLRSSCSCHVLILSKFPHPHKLFFRLIRLFFHWIGAWHWASAGGRFDKKNGDQRASPIAHYKLKRVYYRFTSRLDWICSPVNDRTARIDLTARREQKLVGRRIAALPSKPVHNTVQVYQSTKPIRVIRLHSLKQTCTLPLMMEGCSAIPLGQPSPPQNCCIGRYLYGRLVFFTYASRVVARNL